MDVDYSPNEYLLSLKTIDKLDIACAALGVSPVSNIRNAIDSKIRKISETLRQNLYACFHQTVDKPMKNEVKLLTEKYLDLIEKLKEKCKIASTEEKVNIISLLPKSWSRTRITSEFNAYSECKIGKIKFCYLRPKWVILVGASGAHSVCVCIHDKNVILMMNEGKLDLIVCDRNSYDCMMNSCDQCPDEIQGYRWENGQATVHPSVIFEGEKTKSHSLCVLSNCRAHGTVVVHAFQAKVIGYIKGLKPGIKKMIYFSDGSSSQYKNKKNFVNITNHEKDFDIEAELHFFASYHDKTTCDGVGGITNCEVTRASLQRIVQNQILIPNQIEQLVKEMHDVPKNLKNGRKLVKTGALHGGKESRPEREKSPSNVKGMHFPDNIPHPKKTGKITCRTQPTVLGGFWRDTDYEKPEVVQTDLAFIIPTNNKKRINDDIKELETEGSSSKQMRVKFLSAAPEYDRTGVSDRSVAIIASAVLRDADGRHYMLLKEAGDGYIVHVICEKEADDNIKQSISQYFKETNDISALLAVGCDETVVNSGSKGGVIRFLEGVDSVAEFIRGKTTAHFYFIRGDIVRSNGKEYDAVKYRFFHNIHKPSKDASK
ncbi:hypothetical protein ILUMI_23545 [Ignelater luminosus]|uniref:Uncharacterized protein n=1 Tax=Ignelater luminosus TaxID=2038154 RepID=A0A8K0CAQ4_IGNLU|nr:hypothetical protein ILUMI_23545 [Ignelater luminosus]